MNLNTGTRWCNAGTLRTMVRENSMCKFRPYLPGSTLYCVCTVFEAGKGVERDRNSGCTNGERGTGTSRGWDS